ncbi:MAG: hypothetical protein AAB733_03500, partial [Patescibacteria group bacterium]
MRIGIDCRTILSPNGECAGIGYYTTSLIRALLALDQKNTYVLFCAEGMQDSLFASASNVVMRMFPRKQSIPFISSHVLPAGMIRKERLDVFHGPANVLP